MFGDALDVILASVCVDTVASLFEQALELFVVCLAPMTNSWHDGVL